MPNGFVLVDYGQISLLEIPLFKKSGLVSHGFSTRPGGVGCPPYDTLNLALHVGDDQATVVENRKRICSVLGSDVGKMVTAQQVHGAEVAVVDAGAAGRGAFSYDNALAQTDGLITAEPGLMLATFYADCVPIFIMDPVQKVVASVHAGWKGTVARIGAAAIEKMSRVFASRPSHCLVGIGPSIGPCCYEVDEPLIRRFTGEFSWWPEVLRESGAGKARLDLWQANYKIMTEAGVEPANIELAGMCTCCHDELLFSYRAGRGITGRMGAFIMLKPGTSA